ncbi:hypothetical protein [Olsenella sp. An293]|uniref:hypothetical protein n=1 Tax=Olsenella sp. An293 TaxID=1965626 RepID=UPI000B3830DC|nr:hypothetical protein [Olsenella sp. An293]OUO32264.1 hypothetical protein B5F85_06940 [Olsenella sp. An293]
MSKLMRDLAENARSEKDRKLFTYMADMADEAAKELDEMPEWVKSCAGAILERIPVSVKVEHDGLEVESWISKRGNEMHLVHWADGTKTQFEGPLCKNYVKWDR